LLIIISNSSFNLLALTNYSKSIGYTVNMAGRPPMKEAPDFGKRLASIRQERGLTQQQLADAAGVTRKMIDYYERRAVNVRTDSLISLSNALEMSVDQLLGLASVKKSKPGPKSKLERQMQDVARLSRPQKQFVSQFLETVLASEAAK
jgi:transcriptional regulator with XRE-family HTH domain